MVRRVSSLTFDVFLLSRALEGKWTIVAQFSGGVQRWAQAEGAINSPLPPANAPPACERLPLSRLLVVTYRRFDDESRSLIQFVKRENFWCNKLSPKKFEARELRFVDSLVSSEFA